MTERLLRLLEDPRIAKPWFAGNFGYYWSPQRLLAIAVSHKPKFAAGTDWAYCNTCYLVLGLVVEKVTGHTVGGELAQRIFEPLHLTDTSFDTKQKIAGRHSHGYFRQGTLIDTTLISPSAAWAAGAIVSTADDLSTFFRALYGGKLLRADLLRAMKTPAPQSDPLYGFGLAKLPLGCGTMYGNHGDVVGYGTDTWGTDDGRRFFVLFVNLDEESFTKKIQDAKNDLLSSAFCG